MARDPDNGRRLWRSLEQLRNGLGIGFERSGIGENRLQKGACLRSGDRPAKRRGRLSLAGKEDLHARRSLGRRGGKSPRAQLFPQREEYAFDVLAGAKSVDAMVDAAAGIAPADKIA